MQTIREHVPLAELTTFKIGGTARYFVDVRTEGDIRETIEWAREKGVAHIILSGGSNVLVPDTEMDVLVIHIVGDLFSVSADGCVDAWTGTNLLTLIRSMCAQGWGGWEKLAGIPGTVGGAIRGNAGAFGSEIKDFTLSVHALNCKTDEAKEFQKDEFDFSYRHSFFKDHPEWIVTRVRLQLVQISPDESRQLIDSTIAERERRHLQNVQAAGSFFMNPVAPPELVEMFEKEKGVKSRENRVPAGWLIEKAGMKGAMVGAAKTSEQHPNYLVNTGGATAEDVCALAKKVKAAVREQFSVDLLEEAAIL